MRLIKERLRSIDALRGFDMIWLLGAESLFLGLYTLQNNSFTAELVRQFEHSVWHGFTFYDFIFPLFIFLSGATLGVTKGKFEKLDLSKKRKRYASAAKRVLLLCFLGVLYNHGWGQGLPTSLDEIRFASVLMRIAIAWFFCAVIVWHFEPRLQVVIFFSILVVYWLFQQFVPTPAGAVGQLDGTQSWNAWIDIHFLPGATYQNKALDPEGILSQIPAIANALAGAIVTRVIITNEKMDQFGRLKYLFLIGTCCMLAGWIWSFVLPLNKTLWTSSFSLFSSGLSCLLLGAFYWLFDVKKLSRVNYFFMVIGMNSILLYLLTSLFNWRYVVDSLLGQLVSLFSVGTAVIVTTITLVSIQWLLADWLYKKKVFIRV